MKKIIVLSLLVSASAAEAANQFSFQKRVTPHKLEQELKDAGFPVSGIRCKDAAVPNCVIIWSRPETRSPQPIIEAHVFEDTALRKSKIMALAEKWKAGTITSAGKDELLKLFILQSLGL